MTKTVVMVSGTAWYLWNFRRTIIRGLVDDGWTVHAIAGPDTWSADLAALDGVEVHDWAVSLDGAHPGQELNALMRLFRKIRVLRPAMVFNNGIKANVYGGLVCRALRVPYVNNVSGLGLRVKGEGRGARALARLYAVASARADALLIQNPADLAFLESRGLPRDIRTIRTMGSGVDLDHFAAEPLPDAPPVRVLYVGRLQKDKGIHDFVEAARIVVRTEPDVVFEVIGGREHANAGAVPEDLLEEWTAEGVVTFPGSQRDVRPFLAAAHVLVMPSHGGEGMPKVIIEAAAMGRPAIVSDIDGCRDSIVPSVTGLLAPPCDPEGLADVITGFCRMPDAERQTMSHAARAHAEAHFSDRTILAVYQELLGGLAGSGG